MGISEKQSSWTAGQAELWVSLPVGTIGSLLPAITQEGPQLCGQVMSTVTVEIRWAENPPKSWQHQCRYINRYLILTTICPRIILSLCTQEAKLIPRNLLTCRLTLIPNEGIVNMLTSAGDYPGFLYLFEQTITVTRISQIWIQCYQSMAMDIPCWSDQEVVWILWWRPLRYGQTKLWP